jgi:hypothetical protein
MPLVENETPILAGVLSHFCSKMLANIRVDYEDIEKRNCESSSKAELIYEKKCSALILK